MNEGLEIGDFVSANGWFYGRIDSICDDRIYVINEIGFLLQTKANCIRFIR